MFSNLLPHPTTLVRGIEMILLALVIVAAVYDIRFRRIPNWLTLLGVVAGLGLNAFLFQGWPGLRIGLAGLALGFGVYFLLYALRAMGAGDVKLMAAVGAMVGWQDWFWIFLFTAIIGGVAGLALAVSRRRLKKTLFNVGFILSEMKSGRPAYVGNEELDVRSSKAQRLPHGAIIALGTILFLALNAQHQ
jgi:prepilin peptidase CpaA